jgi:hypothetical protein
MWGSSLVSARHSLIASSQQLPRILLPGIQRLHLLTPRQSLIRGYIAGLLKMRLRLVDF